MLSLFLWLFVAGGIALLGLLWIGSADDEGLAAADGGGFLGAAAAFLSIRTLLAALTAGGATGALLLGPLRLPSVVAVIGAVAGGMVGARLWRAMLRKLRWFDRDHSVSPDLLVGREGVLTVGIGGADAPGIVQLTLGGVSQEYSARSDTGGIFAEGSRVVIVRIESPSTVVVGESPYPELPFTR